MTQFEILVPVLAACAIGAGYLLLRISESRLDAHLKRSKTTPAE